MCAGAQQSAEATSKPSTTSIILQNGPKTGDNGAKYLNVEGKSKGKYASYGLVRFDLTAAKAELDKMFSAGKYQITGIALNLSQSIAGFSAAGGVNIYYTPDDSTAATGLKYPYNPSGPSLKGLQVGSCKFAVSAAHSPAGKTRDICDLTKLAGSKELANHIMQRKTLTLILAEADPNVAATWAGKENGAPPLLSLKASPTVKATTKTAPAKKPAGK